MKFESNYSKCETSLDKAFPLIKYAYEQKQYSYINDFIKSYRYGCIDFSKMYKLKRLLNITEQKSIDTLFDSNFIQDLKEKLSLYIDKKQVNLMHSTDSNFISLSRWISNQYANLQNNTDSLDQNNAFIAYECGNIDTAFYQILHNKACSQTQFAKLVNDIYNQLMGVKITVPDEYRTIEMAYQKCKDRDTIYIKKGDYRTSVEIKKRIAIIGQSNTSVHLEGYFNRPCLIIKSSNIIIQNINFKDSKIGILNLNSLYEIDNCIFSNNANGIVSVITLPGIRNCIFYKNIRGIRLFSNRTTKREIANCIFDKNFHAIDCNDRTEVNICKNLFYKNYISIKLSNDAKRTKTYLNNYFEKINNKHVINDTSEVSIEPLFNSPGPPLFDYSLQINSPFKGTINNVTTGLSK
jgi:hypothetical protein